MVFSINYLNSLSWTSLTQVTLGHLIWPTLRVVTEPKLRADTYFQRNGKWPTLRLKGFWFLVFGFCRGGKWPTLVGNIPTLIESA